METQSETTTRMTLQDIEADFDCPLEWPEPPTCFNDEDKSFLRWATDQIFRPKKDWSIPDDDWSFLLERPSAPTPDDDLRHGLEDMIEMATRADLYLDSKDRAHERRGSLVTCTDDSFFVKIDAECLLRGTLKVRMIDQDVVIEAETLDGETLKRRYTLPSTIDASKVKWEIDRHGYLTIRGRAGDPTQMETSEKTVPTATTSMETVDSVPMKSIKALKPRAIKCRPQYGSVSNGHLAGTKRSLSIPLPWVQ